MTTSRAPTSPDLLIGRTVGTHYVVTRVLARGARSATYLAEHRSLHRQVVLKLLDVEWAGDSDAANRFEQAARSLSTLEAPNIAALIDFGRDPGRGVFVVAELVEGESLADFVVRKGSLSLDEFVPIAAQLLKGLGAAHLRGLLHLDLKPTNVRICVDDGDATRGFTRILDLGLVQLVEGHVQGAEAPVVGDPRYLAPEQISSKPVDTRTDVYALGAIFYELLAGRPPFTGTDAQVVYSQVNDPPPTLATLVGDEELPDELIELIEDCLRKDPDDRPVDANEIVERLIDCVPAALFRVPVPPPKLEDAGAEEAEAPVVGADAGAAAVADDDDDDEAPSPSVSAHARLEAPVLEENITQTRDDPNEASGARSGAPAIGELSIKEPPTASASWAVSEAAERPAPPEEAEKKGGGGFLIFLVLAAAVVAGIYFTKPELLGLGPPPTTTPPVTQGPITPPPAVAPEAPDVPTLLARAKQLEADGDEVAALAAYHQILALDPAHAEANARLAALKGADADAGEAPPTGQAPSEDATTGGGEVEPAAATTTTGADEADVGAASSGGEAESGEDVAPPPVAGGVEVEFTVKPKATLYVDGKKAGSVPGKVSIPPGPHTLKIEAPRYKSWEEKVEIRAGMQPIDVALKRKPRDLSGENVDIDPAEEGPMTQFKFKK